MSETSKNDKKRMTEEEVLFKGIAQDTELKFSTLEFAQLITDKKKAKDLLLSLEIGDKRQMLEELRSFIKSDEKLQDSTRIEYLNIIRDNEEIYNQIEETLLQTIEAEKVEYEVHPFRGIRDTIGDFRETHIETMLRSNVKQISSTQKFLHTEIGQTQLTEENAERVLKILNNVIDTSAYWIQYILDLRDKGKLDLFSEEVKEILDDSLEQSQATIRIAEIKRQKIAEKYPDIAKAVDDEEEKQQSGDER